MLVYNVSMPGFTRKTSTAYTHTLIHTGQVAMLHATITPLHATSHYITPGRFCFKCRRTPGADRGTRHNDAGRKPANRLTRRDVMCGSVCVCSRWENLCFFHRPYAPSRCHVVAARPKATPLHGLQPSPIGRGIRMDYDLYNGWGGEANKPAAW